ncbi:MAG TPA: HEAT repeat domain-containing protein, partial [Candidatus Eisenbacteria bacterium]|nr:HEAT repeat domain-containing protein [Candidatus Eisenbacteria bacterium]
MCRRPVPTRLLVLAILCLATAPAALASATDGVRYRGRLASEWIAELKDADVSTRRVAFAEAIEVEPGIDLLIPALALGLEDQDAQVRVKAADALGRLRHYYVEAFPPLLAAIRNADPAVRLAVIDGLEPAPRMSDCTVYLGPVRPVRHRDVEIPLRAVAAVAGGLKDDDVRVRVGAARVLAALDREFAFRGLTFPIAVPALAAALADTDATVRGAVLDALDRLYSPNDRDYFLGALDDPDPGVRRHAAIGLAHRGLVPGRTIPLLAEILSSEDDTMKRRAIEALRASLSVIKLRAYEEESTATDLAAAAAGVRAALQTGDEMVRIDALHALDDLGPLAATLIPEVTERLGDASSGVRWLASEVLKQIGSDGCRPQPPPAQAPAPPTSTPPAPVPPAAPALAPTPTSPAKVEDGRLEDLVSDLEDSDPAPRFHAAAELFNMGDGARRALPALIEKLAHADPWVRVQVLRIVGHLTRPNQEIVPAIVGAIHDPDPAVRFLAAALLCGSFPGRSEPAIPVLMEMVLERFPPGPDASISCGSDPQMASNAGRREAAFRAFRRIPSSTPGLATALTRLLDSSEAEIRTFAAAELARTGAESLRASPALKGLLSDGDAQVRA